MGAPIDPPVVYGQTVDEQTRCVHWRTALDVVAIKFVCCGRYYPCFECHAAAASHPAVQWPRERWGEAAILCGNCRAELSIDEYKGALAEPGAAASGVAHCPRCGIAINERCSLHSDLYFEQ